MKTFVRKVILFSLIPLGICIAILCTELRREFAWTGIPGDCENRGSWIYQRLFTDSTPVDIAFLGSSRTINGIQDTLLSRLLSASNQKQTNVVNLGYCRFGTDMQYVIAKDLLEEKKVKIIVIEITEGMNSSSHPVFPYYAQTSEIVSPASLLNQAVPSNYYNAFLARLTQSRETIFNVPDTTLPLFPSYGYRGYPDNADPSSLKEPEIAVKSEANPIKRFEKKYPEAWIARLVELCAENNVKVFFLYLPAYDDQPEPTEGLVFYRSLAPVLIPPNTSFRNKTLWRDHDHFNDRGAEILSRWLAGELISE